MKFGRKIFQIILSLGILILPASVFAIGDEFNTTINPQNPSPGENVTITLSSSQFNIDLAQITWTIDGKIKDSGTGKKIIVVPAPANGKNTIVDIKVLPQNGSATVQSLTISSAGVDLIWEVLDGYTPPFYRGKTLPIQQSQIKVVAIPEIKTSANSYAKISNLVYTWRKDGSNMPSQSGFGKNTLVFANQLLDTGNKVELSVTDGSKRADSSIAINPLTPEIIFYEKKTGSGINYAKAFASVNTVEQSRLSVVAEPYFLVKDFNQNDKVTFSWSINGQPVNSPLKNNIVINTEQKGTFSLKASYNETNRLFRQVDAVTNILVK